MESDELTKPQLEAIKIRVAAAQTAANESPNPWTWNVPPTIEHIVLRDVPLLIKSVEQLKATKDG